LVTSPFFSPITLAFIRLFLAFYTLFTSIFILVWEAVRTHDAGSYFSYFTDLSYIGLCAYFCASGVQTLIYARGNREHYPLQTWPQSLQFLHVLLLSTIFTYPILVTVVYWSLLSTPTTFATPYSSWANISRHILNTAFSLFEVAFTHAGPTPWIHLPFVIVILASYLGIAYITRATQGFYAYSFLNPHKEHGKLAIYIVGIALAACLAFTLTRLLCVLREWFVTPRRMDSTHEKDSPPEAIDDWQEIERPDTPVAV